MNSPNTPLTSRSAFMRHRKRSTPHPISMLSKDVKAQDQNESNNDIPEDTTTSATELETSVGRESQLISDDSGIDVSQDNCGEGKRYFLRNKCKDSF